MGPVIALRAAAGSLAVLLAAAAAAAKAPAAAERGAMDAVRLRLERDRAEARAEAARPSPHASYVAGILPLDGWRKIVDETLMARKAPVSNQEKRRAVEAIFARFEKEEEQRKDIEAMRALAEEKKKIVEYTAPLMLDEETPTRDAVYRIQGKFLARDMWVPWKVDSTLADRKRAYQELVRRLKR
jgi:hypothetical protein